MVLWIKNYLWWSVYNILRWFSCLKIKSWMKSHQTMILTQNQFYHNGFFLHNFLLWLFFVDRDVLLKFASTVVLACLTRTNKLFHAFAKNIGQETDVKLRQVAFIYFLLITFNLEKGIINLIEVWIVALEKLPAIVNL